MWAPRATASGSLIATGDNQTSEVRLIPAADSAGRTAAWSAPAR